MHSRETFDALRTAAKQRERTNSFRLAFVAVSLGLGQLVFIRWVEASFPRQTAVAIAVAMFLMYLALVAWLVWRLRLDKRMTAPTCPQCRRPLEGLSERVAVATGRCDACGSQVIA